MCKLENMTMQELHDIYFKEFGYEPSSVKTREDLVKDLDGYTPVSLRDTDGLSLK